jgi:cytochrome P450
MIAFEPYSHEHKQDPYSAYRELRDHAPVHRAPVSGVFCLSRYEDVLHAFRTPETFSSRMDRRKGPLGAERSALKGMQILFTFLRHVRVNPFKTVRGRMLINEDAPVHGEMRQLVNRGFTPRRIAALEPRAREIVAGCMREVGSRERFDLVHDLAIPLPVTLIAELLGIDGRDIRRFKAWSDAIIEGGTGSAVGQGSLAMMRAMGELHDYLRPLIKARRMDPREDLISVLVAAQEGEAGLTDFEILMFVLLLLVAGNETTTNLLGNTVDALLAWPDQLAMVAAEPALVPGLVEEMLRFDGPVQFLTRQVLQDVQLHGVTIPKGSVAVLLTGSANRDERRFTDPDRLDVKRDTRGHLGLGHGAHFCLGASLARLEAKVALEALVRILPGLVRAESETEFLDSYLVRGRTRLELRKAA